MTWEYLQDLLQARAESAPTRYLLFYANGNTTSPKKISYSTLYHQSKEICSIIRRFEAFRKNCTVLLHLDDHWDTILWFWAVLLADGLPVLSSPFSNVENHRRKHIRGLSALLESPICVIRAKSLHLFGHDHGLQLHVIDSLEGVVLPSPLSIALEHEGGTFSGALDWSDIHRRRSDNRALAMLMLTSGSTGNAKAVRITHKQVLSSVFGKSASRLLHPDRPFLNWIGLDHVGALVEIHLHALWLGVDQVHVPTVDIISSPRTFLDLLSRHRVSRSFAPNFFLARLATIVDGKSMDADPTWDFSSLLFLVSGGEANDVKTCVAVSSLLAKYGAPQDIVSPAFGMTETCAGSIYNTEFPRYDTANGLAVASLGKCINGMEMRVTIPGTSTGLVSPGELGDLEVHGPVVFEGYYHNAEATAQAFTSDGWFRTGDQATIDINGYLNLVGRANEVININGVKIIAAEIQMLLEQALQNRVARLVVFGSRAAHTEVVTVAYIPPVERLLDPRDMAEIDNLATEVCMLSTSSRPLVFALRQQSLSILPTSALGKISRAKVRSLFEAGQFAQDVDLSIQAMKRDRNERIRGDQYAPLNEAEALMIDDFAEILGVCPDTLGPHTSVFEQGFTSMDMIKLKNRIDTRLGTEVPIIVVLKNPTARSLAAVLHPQSTHGSLERPSPQVSHEPTYDPVVIFRASGSKTPLWLVHPGVGEVLVFVGLAQHMGDDDRPLYALRARGFEAGQAPFTSILEVVDTYVTAIRRQQPRGPYAIAGYSYGTMLAFEIAKRITSEDGPTAICFLGSFNLPPHIKNRMRYLNWNMCLLNLAHFLDLTTVEYTHGIGEQEFRGKPRAEALGSILIDVDWKRMEDLGLDEEHLVRWVDLAYGLQSMAIDYDPTGQVEVMDVFYAEPLKAVAPSRGIWVRDHLSKWSDFSRTAPRFHKAEGAHYTMMGSDHVLSLSTKLKLALEARGV